MFENLRRSLRDLLDSQPGHGDAGPSLAQMRETLVQARVGLADMRQGIETTRLSLAAKQRELETVQRRKAQAAAIGDGETVRVAERYETELVSRVEVLARKLAVQEDEVAIGEREVSEMTAELRKAIGGVRRCRASSRIRSPIRTARRSTSCPRSSARGRARRAMRTPTTDWPS